MSVVVTHGDEVVNAAGCGHDSQDAAVTEGHDVVIDVQHLVVGALSLIMLATTLIATLNP